MSKITKRTILSQLYTEFHNDINRIIDVTSIFPDHKLVDLVDIVYLISYYFGPHNQYEVIVKDLLKLNGIQVSDEIFEMAYPIIETFINKFKTI
jgi:hypothetical protein